MRIAFWHNLPSGGGKRALYDQIRELVKRGHHVESWCPSTADVGFLQLSDFILEHVQPLNFPKPLLQNKKWSLNDDFNLVKMQIEAIESHCIQCAKEINQKGFDLLISHSCTFFATSPIGKYVDAPKILYLHEPKRFLYEANPLLPWHPIDTMKKKLISPYWFRKQIKDYYYIKGLRKQLFHERINATYFDSILVNSQYSRESVLRAYGLDSKVCYLGIDQDHFRFTNSQRENFLIGIGSFTKNKNIEFVIQSLALIPKPRPELIWIGNVYSNKYLDKLKKLADSLNIIFKPMIRIDDNEVVKLLNSARIMLYAPRLEPFGYAPLEANACGTPVVAVSEGGIRETIINGYNGVLVEHSINAMADATSNLLKNEKMTNQMRSNGRKWVDDHWTLTHSTQRLLERINEVIPNSL